jgi:hypothetical protein
MTPFPSASPGVIRSSFLLNVANGYKTNSLSDDTKSEIEGVIAKVLRVQKKHVTVVDDDNVKSARARRADETRTINFIISVAALGVDDLGPKDAAEVASTLNMAAQTGEISAAFSTINSIVDFIGLDPVAIKNSTLGVGVTSYFAAASPSNVAMVGNSSSSASSLPPWLTPFLGVLGGIVAVCIGTLALKRCCISKRRKPSYFVESKRSPTKAINVVESSPQPLQTPQRLIEKLQIFDFESFSNQQSKTSTPTRGSTSIPATTTATVVSLFANYFRRQKPSYLTDLDISSRMDRMDIRVASSPPLETPQRLIEKLHIFDFESFQPPAGGKSKKSLFLNPVSPQRASAVENSVGGGVTPPPPPPRGLGTPLRFVSSSMSAQTKSPIKLSPSPPARRSQRSLRTRSPSPGPSFSLRVPTTQSPSP